MGSCWKNYVYTDEIILKGRKMLRLENIHKSYGKAKILDGVGFEIYKGDCIGLIGGNGCGKTTLIQILCGTLKPNKGSILNGGEPVERADYKHLFGYLPQNDPLIDELTVKDNLKLWFSAMDIKFRGNDIIDKLGISGYLNKPVNKLSGGMKRRVSLCIAMANKAPILVMDEPTTALDLAAKGEIWQLLKDFITNGGTIVLSTHDYDEIKRCSRLMLMKNGKLKEIDKNTSYNEIIESIIGGVNEGQR